MLLFITISVNAQTEIDEYLALFSNEVNKTLPMEIDKYTTLASTYGGNGKIIYYYTVDLKVLTDYGITKQTLINEQKNILRNSFCTTPSFKIFRENNIEMIWIYSEADGTFFAQFKLRDANCSN